MVPGAASAVALPADGEAPGAAAPAVGADAVGAAAGFDVEAPTPAGVPAGLTAPGARAAGAIGVTEAGFATFAGAAATFGAGFTTGGAAGRAVGTEAPAEALDPAAPPDAPALFAPAADCAAGLLTGTEDFEAAAVAPARPFAPTAAPVGEPEPEASRVAAAPGLFALAERVPSKGSSVRVSSAVLAVETFASFAGSNPAPSWNGVAITSPLSSSALSAASVSASEIRDLNSGAGRSTTSAAGAGAGAAARGSTGRKPDISSSGSTSSRPASREGAAGAGASRSGTTEGGSDAPRRASGSISSSPPVGAPGGDFAGTAASPDGPVLRAGRNAWAPSAGSSMGRSVRGSSIGRDVASINSSLAAWVRWGTESAGRLHRAGGVSSINTRAATPAGTKYSHQAPASEVHNLAILQRLRDTTYVVAHRSKYADAARD